MKIQLNEFEQHIDETILKRGLQYFKNGYVTQVDEITGGEYEAVVEGSETYTVHFEIKKGTINASYCTCPYDMGPFCKHEAAVLFYLQQEELGWTAKTKKNTKAGDELSKKPSKKKKTITEQVDEILEKLSEQDVKSYLKNCCLKDSSFRDLFLAKHLTLTEAVSKELYAKQIRAIVNAATGRHGYIDYDGARVVGNAVHEIGLSAEREIEGENYRVAMFIGTAILEEMSIVINECDDSNGEIGGEIEFAQEILCSIADAEIDESLRKEFFDYCLQSYIKGKFSSWDWHYTMMDIAIALVKDDKEKQLVLNVLDVIKSKDDKWDYEFEKAQSMKLDLIRKTESEENAEAFMQANVNQSEFRKELIRRAIDQNNYNYAIKLCMEGIIKDDSDKPGLALEWRMFLLTIYELKNDVHNVIQTARYLFLNSGRLEPKALYLKMKKYVAADEWSTFFDQLVAHRQKAKSWSDFSSVSNMYIWEEQWENLMNLLLQYTSLENIATLEKYLSKDYAPQLVGLYQPRILKYLERFVGREYYKNACQYIRRMIKLGGRDEADAVISTLKKLYPQRRALMDELKKV